MPDSSPSIYIYAIPACLKYINIASYSSIMVSSWVVMSSSEYQRVGFTISPCSLLGLLLLAYLGEIELKDVYYDSVSILFLRPKVLNKLGIYRDIH